MLSYRAALASGQYAMQSLQTHLLCMLTYRQTTQSTTSSLHPTGPQHACKLHSCWLPTTHEGSQHRIPHLEACAAEGRPVSSTPAPLGVEEILGILVPKFAWVAGYVLRRNGGLS
jgi:hypothetical protein